jgi:hypothetical protein
LEETNSELRGQLSNKEQRSKAGFMDWLGEEVEKVAKEEVEPLS